MRRLSALGPGLRRGTQERRKQDPRFDGYCRKMMEQFRNSPAAPPHPTLSREGRGPEKRTRVNRPRARGWTPDREQRFIEALAATDDVPLAARQVGITPVSAYRHRLARPDFAFRWRLAV